MERRMYLIEQGKGTEIGVAQMYPEPERANLCSRSARIGGRDGLLAVRILPVRSTVRGTLNQIAAR
jgi:hypothetical protein